MLAKRVVFPEAHRAELQPFEWNEQPGPGQVSLASVYTLISPGTELACLAGIESWAPFPFVPGYAGVGTVLAVGEGVDQLHVGDLAFSYTPHASHTLSRTVALPVPAGLAPQEAVFARMAAVAMTAIRVSAAELGDYVAVYGLGLVGNLAAQLFTLAGCEVIGMDLSPQRCALARSCGIAHAIDPSTTDPVAYVRDVSGGEMCATVVEAIGLSPLALASAKLARTGGEVILLGSPRAPYTTDVTPFLRDIHLCDAGCVTYKGAHEWRLPTLRDRQGWIKHSIERNCAIILRLIAAGQLQVAPLLSHILSPADCQQAYEGLRDHKDEYLGVLFDWSQV
ncbi:MAG: zinc-binding alcohol dehydrogenase [Anaerolineales bacterium]